MNLSLSLSFSLFLSLSRNSISRFFDQRQWIKKEGNRPAYKLFSSFHFTGHQTKERYNYVEARPPKFALLSSFNASTRVLKVSHHANPRGGIIIHDNSTFSRIRVISFVQIEYAGLRKAAEEETFEEHMLPAVDYNADANQKRTFKYTKLCRTGSWSRW